MSFYVTLPSNSSMTFFPNNTCTHFMTKLQSPIQLDGPHEVALTEVILPYNWSRIIHAEFIAYNRNTGAQESVRVCWYDDQCIDVIVDKINKEMSDKKHPIKFNYNMENLLCSVNIGDNHGLEFIDSAGKELGFDFQYVEGSRLSNTFYGSNQIVSQVDKISIIYCYTDIIDHQYVGDSYSPLLRTISVPNKSNYGDIINHIFPQPHYVPVCRNNINIIELDLRSDTGEKIKFKSGKVVAKLHFRQKRFF